MVPECKKLAVMLCIGIRDQLVSFPQLLCCSGFSPLSGDTHSMCPTDGKQEVG